MGLAAELRATVALMDRLVAQEERRAEIADAHTTTLERQVTLAERVKATGIGKPASFAPPGSPGAAGPFPLLPVGASAPVPPAVSTGGGSGETPVAAPSAGGGNGTESLLRARNATEFRPREYLDRVCRRTKFKLPNPRNFFALLQDDFVEIAGWACPNGSEFLDPVDAARFAPPTVGAHSSGGGTTAAGAGSGPLFPDQVRTAGYTDPAAQASLHPVGYASKTIATAPPRPTPDGTMIVRALLELPSRIVAEQLKHKATGIEARLQGRPL